MRITLLIITSVFIFFIAEPTSCYSQTKGSWSIGWSLGFTTKGGAFVKYYVADGIALEVFGGGFPHIWHAGTEVSVHPLMLTSTKYRNLAVTAGYSWFGGSGSYSSYNGRGINFGGEFSFTTKQSQLFTKDGIGVNENLFISAGGTYVTSKKTSTSNLEKSKKENIHIDNGKSYLRFVPYLEGGIVIYDSR